jgi:hypothetical protein
MSEEEITDTTKTVALDEGREVYLLNKPDGSYNQGEEGDYRLLTAVFGSSRVILYEAISGTDRYPPGRNMHVELSFEELELLVKSRQEHKAAAMKKQEEYNQKYHLAGDYDPFLDGDNLP